MTSRCVRAFAVTWACVTGCTSEARAVPGSGAWTPSERELFQHLPRDADVVMAGNMYEWSVWLIKSPLGRRRSVAMQPTTAAFAACMARVTRTSRFASTLHQPDGTKGLVARTFVAGLGLDTATTCAKEANIPHTIDPDRRFATFEVWGAHAALVPYLVVADGLYVGTAPTLGGYIELQVLDASRGELEAEIASISRDGGTDVAAISASTTRIDRTAPFWAAGAVAPLRREDATTPDDHITTFAVHATRSPEFAVYAVYEFRDREFAARTLANFERTKDQIKASLPRARGPLNAIRLTSIGDAVAIDVRPKNAVQRDAVSGWLGPLLLPFVPL